MTAYPSSSAERRTKRDNALCQDGIVDLLNDGEGKNRSPRGNPDAVIGDRGPADNRSGGLAV
jgi:hypothetical protein